MIQPGRITFGTHSDEGLVQMIFVFSFVVFRFKMLTFRGAVGRKVLGI